jgi:hypothetical protein
MSLKYIFLLLAIVCLAVGVGTMFLGKSSTAAMLEGGFKGLAGVFFILYYILVLMGKQPTDKTGAEHY